jgi:hypothetical protein
MFEAQKIKALSLVNPSFRALESRPLRINQQSLLLASFEQTLPLRHPSGLIEKHLAQKLLAQSEGNLGELSTLLTTAAIYAIETGIEQINDEVLAAIDWVPPSERRRQAERLV